MLKKSRSEKHYNVYEATCDECSTGYEEVEAENWHDALRQIKEMKWTNNKRDGEWRQTCPDCQ